MNKTVTADIYQEYVKVWKTYEFAMNQAAVMIEEVNRDWERTHGQSLFHHIDSRIKSFDSLSEKMERMGLEKTPENMRRHIKDIAGLRVISRFVSDVDTLADRLSQLKGIKLVAKKDYIRNPKPNGYRSLHLIIEVPVVTDGQTQYIPVEIQLRTVVMDSWASLEHQLVYKSDHQTPVWFTETLRNCSVVLSDFDTGIQVVRDILRQEETSDQDLAAMM